MLHFVYLKLRFGALRQRAAAQDLREVGTLLCIAFHFNASAHVYLSPTTAPAEVRQSFFLRATLHRDQGCDSSDSSDGRGMTLLKKMKEKPTTFTDLPQDLRQRVTQIERTYCTALTDIASHSKRTRKRKTFTLALFANVLLRMFLSTVTEGREETSISESTSLITTENQSRASLGLAVCNNPQLLSDSSTEALDGLYHFQLRQVTTSKVLQPWSAKL